ncbi:MAG: DUF4013 domain-containing protein [Coriobacteriia bacterium]|nr:DUF4013 domain-containing protein [Coriobacteriia bacterium]
MINLDRALKAPFADRDWTKKAFLGLLWCLLGIMLLIEPLIRAAEGFVLGLLWCLLGIMLLVEGLIHAAEGFVSEGFVWCVLCVTILPVLYGAQLEYIRRVARGDDSWPAWDNLAKKWADGSMISIILFICCLPLAAPIGVFVSSLVTVPLAPVIVGLISDVITVVYCLALVAFFPAATVNYAMTRHFGAFFDLRKIVRLVRSKTGYWTVLLYVWGYIILAAASAAIVLFNEVILGSILIGGIIYLATMMSGHVCGQWAAVAFNESSATGSDLPAIPTPDALPPELGNRLQKTYGILALIGAVAWSATIFLRDTSLMNYGVAKQFLWVAPNFAAVWVGVGLTYSLFPRVFKKELDPKNTYFLAEAAFTLLVISEAIHFFFLDARFDIWDVLASAAASIIIAVIYSLSVYSLKKRSRPPAEVGAP